MNSLNEVNRLMGKDFDINKDLSKMRAGEVGNRILGNAPVRVLSSVDNIEKLLKELGKGTEDDLRKQFLFADLLEDVFEITQERSLRGQVTKAGEDTLNKMNIIEKIGNGNYGGLAKNIVENISGATKEKKQQILWSLIKN
jgi:hypothetical protein